jgi:flavodoxin
MKALVVFYSFDGNTRFIAKRIAEACGADLAELKVKDEAHPRGFMKFLWGGRQVVMGREPELLPLEKDPADYDLIFLGSPVWAFSITPAMRAFLAHARLQGKKTALFCCHGGGKGRFFRKMQDALPGATILAETDFVEPIRTGSARHAERAAQWARDVAAQA